MEEKRGDTPRSLYLRRLVEADLGAGYTAARAVRSIPRRKAVVDDIDFGDPNGIFSCSVCGFSDDKARPCPDHPHIELSPF